MRLGNVVSAVILGLSVVELAKAQLECPVGLPPLQYLACMESVKRAEDQTRALEDQTRALEDISRQLRMLRMEQTQTPCQYTQADMDDVLKLVKATLDNKDQLIAEGNQQIEWRDQLIEVANSLILAKDQEIAKLKRSTVRKRKAVK